jgi:hypothetical protein
MNKNIFVIILALTAPLAVFAVPVIATSTRKIPVTFSAIVTRDQDPIPWPSGDVIHGRKGTLDFDNCVITGDDITLEGGVGVKTYDYDINVKGVELTPGPPLAINGKGVLRYSLVIDFGDGTFEGKHELRGEFKVFDSGYVHPYNCFGYAVYRGTGDYLGWTWVMSDVTINGVPQFEAYILIP